MRVVKVGSVPLGDGRIAIQSMTTHKTSDVERSVAQILRLEEAGCEIVRVAVLDEEDAKSIRTIKERVHIPIVADIHFSARLACLAAEYGADKLRVNPGNIGGEKEIKLVSDCVRAYGVPVRVGSNSGSIEKSAMEKWGVSAAALVESALSNVRLFEKYGVTEIVVSVKSSSVPLTVEAYRLLKTRTDYPLHVGVTEAGVGESALVKSSVGIGALLLDGIGDTIRVSLSGDPVEEVRAAKRILRACGLDKEYVEVVACPTCGRCAYACAALAQKVSDRAEGIAKRLKIAVMGCVVNGPGEARDADLGIAGGKEYCVIFEKGKADTRVAASVAEEEFFKRLEALLC